jgi:RNase P subunit RPR2
MIIESVEEVLSFIEDIKDEFRETKLYKEYDVDPEWFFTCGGCGQFYTILKSAFPQAKLALVNDFSHVVTEIDGMFYDIRGLYLDEYFWGSLTDIEITPEIEKFVTNYAFSLEEGWYSRELGPTAVNYVQVIDEMSMFEKLHLFKAFKKYECKYLMDQYIDYKKEKPNLEKESKNVVFYGVGVAAVEA